MSDKDIFDIIDFKTFHEELSELSKTHTRNESLKALVEKYDCKKIHSSKLTSIYTQQPVIVPDFKKYYTSQKVEVEIQLKSSNKNVVTIPKEIFDKLGIDEEQFVIRLSGGSNDKIQIFGKEQLSSKKKRDAEKIKKMNESKQEKQEKQEETQEQEE